MEEVSHLIIKVSSDDVKSATRNLDSLAKASDNVMGLIKGLVTAAAAMAIFKQAAGAIADFEHELSQVRAVTQATEKEMRQMSDAAKEFGLKTRFSAQEAASGMKLLGQAGFTTQQILAAMPGVLDLATAGELGLAEAADVTASALAGFRLRASESNRVADALAVGASKSNTSVADLGVAMKYVAPIAATMNKSVEEVTAALGVMSNAGIQGSMAGTGLRQILSSLASPTKEASDTLRAYGIAIDDVNPATQSLTHVIEALKKGGLDAAGAFEIFGDRGAPAILALTSQTGALRDLNGALSKSGGAAKEMARVMGDDLTGDLLKLKNATKGLYIDIGEAGLKKALREATQATTEFVKAIDDMVQSGEAAAWFDLMKTKLGFLSDGFANAAQNISEVWALTMEFLKNDGKEGADNIVNAFKYMPENIRTLIQAVGIGFGTLVNYIEPVLTATKDVFFAWFDLIIRGAKNAGREFLDNLKSPFLEFMIFLKESEIKIAETVNKLLPKPKFDESFFADLRKDIEEYKKSLAGTKNNFWQNEIDSIKKYKSEVENARAVIFERWKTATDAFKEQISLIVTENEENRKASDDKLKRIEELRAAYAKLKAAREAAEKEAANTAGTPGRPPPNEPPPDTNPHFNVQEFDALRKSLQLEEITIQESYDKRLDLIKRNTKAGSALRLSLTRELEKQYTAELESLYSERADKVIALEDEIEKALEEGRISKVDGLVHAMHREEEEIKASYDRRREQILKDTTLTEEQKAAKIAELSSKQLQQQREIEAKRNEIMLKHASDFFGNISTIAGAFGAKGARIAKAAAITQTLIKTYESATSAYAAMAGIPYIGPALGVTAAAAAVAAGLANVQQIKSQNYSGAYEYGGMIPSGKVGLVGEAGPELVRGPAVVTSARTTAANSTAPKPVNFMLKIDNHTDGVATVEERDTSDGKIVNVIIKRVKSEIAGDIRQGGNPIAHALEKNYRLNRGAAA